MADGIRILLVLLAAGLILLGLALGAESQEERFLGPQEDLEYGQARAAGNLVPVTALLVGAGAAWGATLLSRAPPRRRVVPGLEVGVGAWLLVVLVQSAYPNYDVLYESRFATLSISPILLDAEGVSLVLVSILALWAAALLGTGHGLWRLLGNTGKTGEMSGGHLFGGHLARTLFVLPFLLAIAWGALELLTEVPVEEPGNGLALALLPLSAAAALALAVTHLLRAWSLAEAVAYPRMAPVAREAWRTLDRIEAPVAAILVVVALAGTLLPKTDMDAVALDRVLRFSLRSAVQGTALVVLPLAWLWTHDRRVWTHLQQDFRMGPAMPLARPLALITIALAALAAVVSGAAVLLGTSALLPWTLSTLVLGVFAGIALPRVAGAPVLLMAAACMWAAGNTVSGQHDPGALKLLDFDVNPGVLILWRILGAGFAAWALARLARATAPRMRRSLAMPLALVVGGAMALVGWLDLAFTAWIVPGGADADAVAVGSVVRSLPVDVRTALHVFGALVSGVGALALARLVRPEWFRRGPRPAPAPTPGAGPLPA